MCVCVCVYVCVCMCVSAHSTRVRRASACLRAVSRERARMSVCVLCTLVYERIAWLLVRLAHVAHLHAGAGASLKSRKLFEHILYEVVANNIRGIFSIVWASCIRLERLREHNARFTRAESTRGVWGVCMFMAEEEA